MPDTSTRDVVTEVYDRLAAAGSEEPAQADVEPAAEASAEAEPAAAAEPERAAPPAGRDEKGRFAPKTGKEPAATGPAPTAPDAVAEEAVVATPAVPAAPVLSKLKAPQDWRAAAGEDFDKAPRAVQEEVLRTYAETRKTLDLKAQFEKEAGAWREPLAPFEHVFRARGQTLQQGITGLAQTYAALHTAPPAMRGQILGRLVREFMGGDEAALAHLANGIHGSESVQPVAQPQAMHPDQIRQLARQEWEAAQAEQARNAAVSTWEEFAKTAEFLEEPGFRQRLAVELQLGMAEKGGQPTKDDIQRAFDATCQSHPSVAKIVNQRKEAAAAKAKVASTPAAGSGVKNEPAGPAVSGKAKNTRDEVTKQYDRLARSRA